MRLRHLLAGVGVLGAGVAGLALLGEGREGTLVANARPGASTPELPVDPVALPTGTPAHLLAGDPETGVVALLDPGSGAPLKILATAAPDGDRRLSGVAIAPHGRSAYYSVGSGCSELALFRVPVAGGVPHQVATGTAPALSPDGRLLAFAAPGADGGCPNTIVVRDLRSGDDRRFAFPDDDEYRRGYFTEAVFSRLAWAPDNRRLAFTHSYEGDSIAVLDTRDHLDLSQTTEVVIPGGGGDSRHPAWAVDGRLALVNQAFQCCFEDDYEGPPRALLVDVDARTMSDLFGAGEPPPALLDYDRTGAHLLYVDGGSLYRRSPGSPVALVAPGFSLADW